jgi:hypothetical protein
LCSAVRWIIAVYWKSLMTPINALCEQESEFSNIETEHVDKHCFTGNTYLSLH